MSNLAERLMKSGAIKHTTLLSDSTVFNVKDMVSTDIPIINIALSGAVTGGLSSGLTFLAGESRNFKSLLGLIMVKAYLDKHEDGVCLFYDSEFGTTPEYIKTLNIDADRVIHAPVEHIEQLKFDISKRLETIERGDRVIIFIDSVGNLASKKEVEDALDGKAVADMSRAKAMKSLWRIITPQLTSKDIPCVAINHTYKTMELYAKNVMSGGTGGMYSANQVFIITKAQEKDGKDLKGWNFTINIEKSRFVRDKSKFPFLVTWEHGLHKWSGLLEIGEELGYIVKPKVGWYQSVDVETGEVLTDKMMRAKEILDSDEVWEKLLNDTNFPAAILKRYSVTSHGLLEGDKDD